MPRAFLMSTKNKMKTVKTGDPTLERTKDNIVRTISSDRRADEEHETPTIDLERLKEETVHPKYVNETNMKKGKFSICSVIVSSPSNKRKQSITC